MDYLNIIKNRLNWLANEQKNNGSWQNEQHTSLLIDTCFSIMALQTYKYYLPYEDKYNYDVNINKGLCYIVSQIEINTECNICFKNCNNNDLVAGLVLTTICLCTSPDCIIKTQSSSICGKTYKEIANIIINQLIYNKYDNETFNNKLSWNLTNAFVLYGISYATSDLYKFKCEIPNDFKIYLKSFVDYKVKQLTKCKICNTKCKKFILNTIILCNIVYLCEFNINLDLIKNIIATDEQLFNLISSEKIGLTDYQLLFLYTNNILCQDQTNNLLKINKEQLKHYIFQLLNIDHIKNHCCCKNTIQTNALALLIIRGCLHKLDKECTLKVKTFIDVQDEIKLFIKKFVHHESENCKHAKPKIGDNISLTITFGNNGSKKYIALPNTNTVEGSLVVAPNTCLKVVNLCLPENFRVYNEYTNEPLLTGSKLCGQNNYNLKIQQFVKNKWTSSFDICCHKIYTLSLMFETYVANDFCDV